MSHRGDLSQSDGQPSAACSSVGAKCWLVNHTLSFENIVAFQASWVFKLYPPLPDLPASPSGLGILMALESRDDKEESDEVALDMPLSVDGSSGTG